MIRVGDRVEAGRPGTAEHDRGRVQDIERGRDGYQGRALVWWDVAQVAYWEEVADLRPEAPRGHRSEGPSFPPTRTASRSTPTRTSARARAWREGTSVYHLNFGNGQVLAEAERELAAHPVCPRCLDVEPGIAAGDPDHPHPGPFTRELCAACAARAKPNANNLTPTETTP